MWDFCLVYFILLNNCMIRFWALLIIKCDLSKLLKASPRARQDWVPNTFLSLHLNFELSFQYVDPCKRSKRPNLVLRLKPGSNSQKKREKRSCNSQVWGGAPTPMSTFYCFCVLITIIKKSSVLKSVRSNKKMNEKVIFNWNKV